MAEAYLLPITRDPELIEEEVNSWLEEDFEGQHVTLLTDLGKGAIRFATAVFPEASLEQIYAQSNMRESEGRGPHFDIHNEGLSDDYPWLGVYNIAGTCGVSVAEMPAPLAEQYAELYPEPNEAAYKARRRFGALVLGADTSQVGVGSLKPDMGLVLPQRLGGPHIIHKITPDKPDEPGSFIKMIVPKADAKTLEDLSEQGFMTLDELATQCIEASTKDRDGLTAFLGRELERTSRRAESAGVGGGRLD